MNNLNIGTICMLLFLISFIWSTNVAAEQQPLTPELAAKREMVRKQEEQRITPDKRKAAAEALKAERLKVYQAKEALKQQNPPLVVNK